MSFNDKEISTQDGRPSALYRLDWGRNSWFYTSADRAISREELVNGEMQTVTYEPRAVKDNGMIQGSSQQNDFTLDGPSNLPIVDLYRATPPSETIWLTVRRCHDEDAVEAPIYWKGVVMNVKKPSMAKCQIIGQPLTATLKRTGLRLCWTKECPHFLYDQACRVSPNAFSVRATVATAGGNLVTVAPEASKPNGWFRGGYIEWQASAEGTKERRFIESDITDEDTQLTQLTIFGLADSSIEDQEVFLYPGCNRSPGDCSNKFDNLDNYGGFDKMPGASPFTTPIW